MQERVGECSGCGKVVYCLEGFLNGVVLADGKIRCFDCDRKGKEKELKRDDPR
ncbi:hypothetical protein C8P63_103144 [Melghirimyces profundicolus]|uniref:Uncharacterized protein n=1 Tax=Melghirimyces profundicolus TaxID=1242148 RepID=A0A2T6C7Q6_9BACL|nr:hypothetical protein [Melghirimyces profundicolus]PTX64359.1 hypothetical protein C8P63_103144 [Melghirimyces profundicolus]